MPEVVIDCSTQTRPSDKMLMRPSGGDDTARIQAALDAAVTQATATGAGIPQLALSAGDYHISDTINWTGSTIIGAGPGIGTRIYWDGPTDQIAFDRTGNLSYGGMVDLQLMPGDTEPAYWLDLTARYVDKMFELRRVQFVGGSSGAIKMAGWWNCHWYDLRFDQVGGFAIDAAIPNDQYFLASFVLDQFTYDHSRADNLGQGFIRVNNPGAVNMGPIAIRGGRIEINRAWSGVKAILNPVHEAGAVGGSLGWRFDDVTCQNVGSFPDHVIINRGGSNTTAGEQVLSVNSRFAGMEFAAGTWPPGNVFPTTISNRLSTFIWNFDGTYIVEPAYLTPS